jgi:hypothetical protein
VSVWRAFALWLACTCCSDSVTCTAAGCLDGFSIDLSQALGSQELASTLPLPAGAYEVELALDGTQVTCHRTIPEELPLDCNAPPILVERVVSMRSGMTFGFDVEIRETPRVVNALIRYQGSTLAQGSFSPEYRKVEPNGAACGPVCRSAPREMLTLAF